MMLYWRFAWRELRQRPSRPILTLLSVVIGVAAIVATTMATGTARRAFDEIYKTVAGKAALEIATPTGVSFDEAVLPKIREVKGVKVVTPLMKRDTSLSSDKVLVNGKKKAFRLKAFGVDPEFDREVHEYEITDGKPLNEASGLLLEQDFAEKLKVKVGDSVDFLCREGFVPAEVVGFFKPKDTAGTTEGSTIYMPLVAAQYYFKNQNKVDSALVVTDPDADVKVVQAEIAKVLPEGLKVEPPLTHSAMAEETSMSTNQGMRMAQAFSVIVAILIIANTFLINVTQRRKQMGIMRAIGATRNQIAGMVYREAILMGVLGTILGSLLGIVAAHYLSGAMGTLYQATLPGIEITPRPFIYGGMCGIGISLLAALIPARKARTLSPLEAMRDVLPGEIAGTSWWFVGAGVIIEVLGSLVIALSIFGILPMQATIFASILLLVGLVFLLPMFLKPVSGVVALLLRPFFPIEGRLARRQLLRHRTRTALTVGVVFIAAATGIGLANSVIDNVNDVREWYRKTIVADFFMRASAPSMSDYTSAELPEDLGSELKKVDGITSLNALRLARAEVAGQTASLVARDHNEEGAPELDVVSGNANELRERFKNGEVALGTVLARRAHLKVGDEISLDTANGKKNFKIAALVNDYQAGGLTVHIERSVARLDLGYEGITSYIIKVDHNKMAEVREKLKAIADENGLMLSSFEEIQQSIDHMMSGVVASLWAMVVLALLVSAVGVTNTLTINVLEQTRELGLLRIVAMTQNQVRKTVFTQAVIMALLALIPGIIAGISVAYLINVAMMPVIGHAVQYRLHPALLLGGLAVGLAVVAFAAWFPSNRAAKLDLLDALRTL
jgi:putative ABC transport system permease protein